MAGLRHRRRDWIRSDLSAAIRVGKEMIGFLCLDSATPNAFTAEHVERLKTFASQAAIALENARLYGEAQREKQYFESLVLNNPAAVVVVDRDANVLSWNPAAESLFGYPKGEAIGRNIDDLVANEATRAEATTYSRQAGAGNASPCHHTPQAPERQPGGCRAARRTGDHRGKACQLAGHLPRHQRTAAGSAGRAEAARFG